MDEGGFQDTRITIDEEEKPERSDAFSFRRTCAAVGAEPRLESVHAFGPEVFNLTIERDDIVVEDEHCAPASSVNWYTNEQIDSTCNANLGVCHEIAASKISRCEAW